MVTELRYGELSEEWASDWGCGDNPYAVLKDWKELEIGHHDMDIFGWAEKHCTDEKWVDWGSCAWKCRGSELIELAQHGDNYVENVEEVNPEGVYGIVFIEVY